MLENSETGDSTDNSLPNTSLGLSFPTPTSPPDQASIQSSMDKNKETLKRKLMLRRSVTELVDQGIYPSLKTPPAFADKTRQLERAKTGDLLRQKIQQRPNRQLLVQQHILEDTNIDPSLHERQRLLKRSRLLDDLNDKLYHRPGPLELVQGNILQPPPELVNAIRDGTVQFISTSDTEDMDQSSPSFTFDDKCLGSDGIQCPSFDEASALYVFSSPSPVLPAECLPMSPTLTNNMPVSVSSCPQIPFIISTIPSASGSMSDVLSNHPGTSNIAVISIDNNNNNSNNNNGNKSRIKKPKPKVIPKSRIIKFHEYKGPPSAVKNQSSNTSASTSSNSVGETPYHILLQQQQLFLRLQMEFQQRQQQQSSGLIPGTPPEQNSASGIQSVVLTSPPIQPSLAGNAAIVQAISLHEPQVNSTNNATHTVVRQITVSPVTTAQTPVQILNAQTTSTSQAPLLLPQTRPTQSAPRQSAKALTSIPTSALSLPKLTGNIEEMKVADLKAELKKRSLPVSGSKPQLIERLKPFTDSSSNIHSPSSVIPKSDSRPPSRVSTPLQFNQTPHTSSQSNDYANVISATQHNTSTTATSLVNSCHNISRKLTPGFSVLPLGTKEGRTIVSVKPLIKTDLATTTAVSSLVSPQTLMTTSSETISTISPGRQVILASKSPKPTDTNFQTLVRFAPVTNKTMFPSGDQNTISSASAQALASVTTETTQPTSEAPAGTLAMEVDPVLLPLFRRSVNSVLVENSSASMDTGVDDSADIKNITVNPNTNPATSRIINLGSSADSSFKINSHSTEPPGFQTTNRNTGGDVSHPQTLEVPVPHQSSTNMSQIQLATPHDQTLQQLQQLHILQQLQQQLMQQTQSQQQPFPHQIFQQPSSSSPVQLTNSDQMVLAQAKQIEDLQRQLQESHLILELHQQQQQQQQQHQQHQQQHQQRLVHVQMPSDFAQNSLSSKLSQNQQTIMPLVGHGISVQQQQPSLVMQHQQEPSVGFSNPAVQQTPNVLSGQSTAKSQMSGNQALVQTAVPTTDVPSDYNSSVISRTSSVPPTPLVTNQQKLNIHRCSSAPYINGQLKDPPYYHEAVRLKQQQMNFQGNIKNSATSLSSPTSCLNLEQAAPDCKSQAMDDVLEILIRNGDLPLNAAAETVTATTIGSSASSLQGSSSMLPVSVATTKNQMDSFVCPMPSITSAMRSQQNNQPSTSSTDSSDPILTLEHADIFNKALLNDTQFSSSKTPDAAGPSSPFMNEDTSNSMFGEFLDWGEMIPSSDLSTMDFSVAFGFDQLYLGDSEHNLDANMYHDNQFNSEQTKSKLAASSGLNTSYLTGVPNCQNDNNAINIYMNGSEPRSSLDLHAHYHEIVTPSNQMDTSEWIDAMMPSSNVSHMNTGYMNRSASTSFTTDSYLTPHTQQESDHFSDPGMIQSPLGWEQLTNQGTSS
ncbi:hypothetical protein BsWGS_06427 [Bradybaena similaris]